MVSETGRTQIEGVSASGNEETPVLHSYQRRVDFKDVLAEWLVDNLFVVNFTEYDIWKKIICSVLRK